MKRYIINQPKEQGTYSLGDSVFTQINIKNILTNTLSDPSSVSISIITPNGTTLVSSAAMSNPTTGIYSYDYSIPTSQCYGIYSIIIETTTYDTLNNFYFVVFPWDVVQRMRELSGASQQNDISDYSLALIAWNSYIETLYNIYELHEIECPNYDPVSKSYFNGINKRFQVYNSPIADIDGDGVVTGYGESSCGTDVNAIYYDSTGAKQQAKVNIIDANIGLIEITDLAGNALPQSTIRAAVTYYSQSPNYDEKLMHEAVAYLASYKAALTFQSLDKATLTDLQSNRASLSDRFLKRYEDLISELGFNAIGCGK